MATELTRMDMAARFDEQRAFFATGRREDGAEPIAALGLVPAAFAPYRDLARLRHDFPLVLVRDARGGCAPARSLTALVDEVLRALAPKGMAGERLRKHALRLEREIRARVYAGDAGLLSELWEAAAESLPSPNPLPREGEKQPPSPLGEGRGEGKTDASAEEILRYSAGVLALDGEVIGCDAAMPARLLTHAWEEAHAAKAKNFRALVDALVVRLSDILRAAFIHSAAGAEPEALRASVGAPHGDEFDFAVMSRLVGRRAPRDELAAGRRARIESALAVLRAQRFFADPKAARLSGGAEAYEFRFADCAGAARAFRERLPALLETVKAIAMAELEAGGSYDEARHDAFFEGFGAHALTAEDLALFPDYLVCIPPGSNGAFENANLMEMLSSGLPVKVLVETGDALEEAAIGAGSFAFGVRSTRLAMTATSLGGVFVLQAPGSNLHALRERLTAGLRHRGPALFSVFAGSDSPAAGLPAYLIAAAAMQSRAFPSFCYDPHAGPNLAARFAFENNPQPEADWPVAPLEYADEQMQRVTVNPAFTFADFALCDRRYEGHFARVPRERWNEAMVPVADWIALGEEAAAQKVPYLLAVDAGNVLHRVLVDSRLMQATRRCLVLWRRLQEQGGIHNSHAERLLARAKAAWEAEKAGELEALRAAGAAAPVAAAGPAATAAPAQAAAAPEPVPERPPGEPWIETARCPSCNECQLINDKLFLYNANKQAYIGDLKAGTFRQMVEAAETCQVSIIHPGKPWDPKESGLAELVERAQPFQ
jgi:hypothetical protein